MTQHFIVTQTSLLDSPDFDTVREVAHKILSQLQSGLSVNQIIEIGLLPPQEVSNLILKMFTAGIIVPQTEENKAVQQVQIVVDSPADLPKELAKELDILQVPLEVHFGKKTFADGVDIDAITFYQMLASTGKLPSTSPPSVEVFHNIFEQVIGERDILCIHLFKKMSTTINIAEQTIRKYFNSYLRKREKGSRGESRFTIEIIDSMQVSMGTGLLAIEAAECAQKGMGVIEIRDYILSIRDRVHVSFMVDKLDHLARGRGQRKNQKSWRPFCAKKTFEVNEARD